MVPGHAGIVGNEMAGQLARDGSDKEVGRSSLPCGILASEHKEKIKRKT